MASFLQSWLLPAEEQFLEMNAKLHVKCLPHSLPSIGSAQQVLAALGLSSSSSSLLLARGEASDEEGIVRGQLSSQPEPGFRSQLRSLKP